MWPLIIRELRTSARHWRTYWLRLLAAGAVLAAVVLWLGNHPYTSQAGSELFGLVHRVLLVCIWVIVPLMACDTLSKEKREGTLGLLFLTHLRAYEIVLAKAIACGWRAFSLWLATLPLVAVPVLLGGLNWVEVMYSTALCLASLLVALATAMLASALRRSIEGAIGMTAFLLPFSYLALAIAALLSYWMAGGQLISGPATKQLMRAFEIAPHWWFWNTDGVWQDELANPRSTASLLASAAVLIVFSIWCVVLLGSSTAFVLKQAWQDKSKSKQRTEVENLFCTPCVLPGVFRSWMRRSLTRNPIGWLEKRSWTGRIASWVWLAIMISFASSLVSYLHVFHIGMFIVLNALNWLLVVSLAFVASGSFRRERETGALELILVTPLRERDIIVGRLAGLWTQFLPAFAVSLAVVIYLLVGFQGTALQTGWSQQVMSMVQLVVAYLTVPVVGLYFSLRSKVTLVSWILTLGIALFVPQAVWIGAQLVLSRWWEIHEPDAELAAYRLLLVLPYQLILASLLLRRMHANLNQRNFALH